jgi:hypothetical protein
MNAINAALTEFVDWLLGPLADWPPLAPLLFWSAVAGVLMTVVFRYTSNQQAVRRAADRSRAQALAIKLFGHDPRAVFGSLFQLLRYTALRLLYSLPPVLVMLIPFTLFFSQLALRYEYRPLEPERRAIVKLELAEKDWPQHQNVTLEAPSQIKVETPALRDASQHAIYWRLRPTVAQPATLRWQVGGEQIEKRVDVASDKDRLATVSTRRPGRGWWDRLLNPAEPALPSGSPVVGIEIEHPPRETLIWGLNVPWWLTSVVASIVAALFAAPIVKVRF